MRSAARWASSSPNAPTPAPTQRRAASGRGSAQAGYVERLQTIDSRSALVIACDKLHNTSTLLVDLEAPRASDAGPLQHAGAEQLWYFLAVAAASPGACPPACIAAGGPRRDVRGLDRRRRVARRPGLKGHVLTNWPRRPSALEQGRHAAELEQVAEQAQGVEQEASSSCSSTSKSSSSSARSCASRRGAPARPTPRSSMSRRSMARPSSLRCSWSRRGSWWWSPIASHQAAQRDRWRAALIRMAAVERSRVMRSADGPGSNDHEPSVHENIDSTSCAGSARRAPSLSSRSRIRPFPSRTSPIRLPVVRARRSWAWSYCARVNKPRASEAVGEAVAGLVGCGRTPARRDGQPQGLLERALAQPQACRCGPRCGTATGAPGSGKSRRRPPSGQVSALASGARAGEADSARLGSCVSILGFVRLRQRRVRHPG